jgi:addiction module HigA family antidote
MSRVSRIAAILMGTCAITADTALRLSQYFGTSAEMWLSLQSQYDLRVAQRTTGATDQSAHQGPQGGLTP